MFVGIGAALAGAGPAGLLMAFIITGMVVWTVMQSIGEMATLVSVSLPTLLSFRLLCLPPVWSSLSASSRSLATSLISLLGT